MKIFSTILLAIFLFTANSCEGQNKNSKFSHTKNEIMKEGNALPETNQSDKIALLKKSMLNYLKIAQPSYTKADVEMCIKLLEDYCVKTAASKSKNEGMEMVKITVEKLNDLNEKCNSELIETSEREQIADIIISESVNKGYSKPDDDITEEWREW
ncbi:hypothetical protein ASG01_11335 [Chryseobacterium sp. Leaf180]|nr:hypothetical protein ASG01_11335 [Chryseobacterium sp. Leaf180]